MRKVFEFCILSVIKQGEAYPSDIIDKMKAANLNIFRRNPVSPTHQAQKTQSCSPTGGWKIAGRHAKYFALTEKGPSSTKNWKQPGTNWPMRFRRLHHNQHINFNDH